MMKSMDTVTTLLLISLVLLATSKNISEANAQTLPTPDQILEKMTLANAYFMNKWPDPGVPIVTDKTRPSNIWTRATYYEGLMAFYRINAKEEYYNYAVQWGESHGWEPAYGDTSTRHADNQACGQTYLELYLIDRQPERILCIKTTIDRMVNSDQSDDWSWVDALHMAMPVFAKLGAVYNDSRYFEKMYDLYQFTKTKHGDAGLYNPNDHLWWRDKDFDPPYTEPNGEDCYWSRGNGWAFVALARVLEVLPKTEPHREEYITNFKEMAEALIAVQRDDGFWNVSLHDPDNFGGPETSGTALFTFGLAWGINKGLLVGDRYRLAAVKGWNGMVKDALHDNGFLGYVQGTGKEPASSQPVTYDRVPNFEDYALGAFLLAGSEIYRLVTGATSVEQPDNMDSAIPEAAILHPIYPNPLNPETTLSYTLTHSTRVRLAIYDSLGKEVAILVNDVQQAAGEHRVLWRGTDNSGRQIPSGAYLVVLKTPDATMVQKVSLVK